MANKNERLQFILDMVDQMTGPATKATKSLKGLGEDVTATQKKLGALNKQAGDISKLAAMRGEMERNSATSKALAEKVGSLKVQMAMTEKPTKAMRDNLRAAVKEQKDHQKTSDKHKEALAKLQTTLAKSGVDINRLGDAERKTRLAIASTNTELAKQQKELDQATRKQEQLTKAKESYAKAEERAKAAMGAGTKMAVAGAALGGGLLAAGAPNYDFQRQMSAVQAIGDFSDKDRARLTASARKEASVSSFGAMEAGQAQGYLAAAGFKVDDIEKSLKGVLNLAAATETGLAETADISSNILSGFGWGADQMGRMGDILTATTSGHNVNLQMLGESMKYVAPIAKQTDQSAESIAAMVGLLGDVGIQGSMAGTALKGAMLRLSGPTKDAQKAFDSLNVSTKDAQGNVRAMPEVLAELQTKMKGMGSGDKLALLKRMFGEEPAAAIAVLLDKAGDTIEAKTQRLMKSAGAADRAAFIRMNNLWGDVQNFKSSVEETQLQFGGMLDKALRGLVRMATAGVDAFTKWQKENPKLAQTLALVTAALSVLLTVTGSVVVGLGALWLIGAKMRLMWFLMRWAAMGFIKTLAMKTAAVAVAAAGYAFAVVKGTAWVAWMVTSKTAMLAWAVVCNTAKVAMAALNVVMRLNPIGLLITAITALVAAGIWLYQNWDNLPEAFARVWASVKEFIGFDPMAMISGVWDGVADYFTGLFGGIWDSFIGVFSKIGDKLSSLGDWALGGFGMFDPELAEQVADAPAAGETSPVVNGKPATKAGTIPPAQQKVEMNDNSSTSVVIHAAPGMNEEQIAALVVKKLDEEKRKARQQERARNKD